jgi:hypothetical protein
VKRFIATGLPVDVYPVAACSSHEAMVSGMYFGDLPPTADALHLYKSDGGDHEHNSTALTADSTCVSVHGCVRRGTCAQ